MLLNLIHAFTPKLKLWVPQQVATDKEKLLMVERIICTRSVRKEWFSPHHLRIHHLPLLMTKPIPLLQSCEAVPMLQVAVLMPEKYKRLLFQKICFGKYGRNNKYIQISNDLLVPTFVIFELFHIQMHLLLRSPHLTISFYGSIQLSYLINYIFSFKCDN
jgi:hypothetical protein